MPIDREPGGSTMIRVSIEVKDQLNALKSIEREAIGDVVKRILIENRALQTEKSALLKQIQSFKITPGSLMPMTVPDLNLQPKERGPPA